MHFIICTLLTIATLMLMLFMNFVTTDRVERTLYTITFSVGMVIMMVSGIASVL